MHIKLTIFIDSTIHSPQIPVLKPGTAKRRLKLLLEIAKP